MNSGPDTHTSLRRRICGAVRLPGDGAPCEHARQVRNADIDRRPGAIVQPAHEADIQATVRYADEHDLPVNRRAARQQRPRFACAITGRKNLMTATRAQRPDPPVGIWYSTIVFADGHAEHSIVRYSADGGLAETSTRYPTRLGGIGEWRPAGTGRFAGYFREIRYPGRPDHAAGLGARRVRSCAERSRNYTADARGIFMDLDRDVLHTVPTAVTARRMPWRLRRTSRSWRRGSPSRSSSTTFSGLTSKARKS